MSVLLDIDEHVATITLNRPEKLNALTLEMLDAFEGYLADLERNPEVRVLIVTGAGDRAFCVGADIHAWAELDAVAMWRDWIRDGHRVFGRLAALRVPTIAALNGYTFGGGLELALSTDLRIAAEGIELALPEVKLGIVPGWSGTQRLPVLIGVARAKQMIFTGARIGATQALAWGLVNEVAPAGRLMERAEAVAASIAENAPLAVQMTKQLVDGGLDAPGYFLEALASGMARFTGDAAEGIAAFKERRSAVYRGR